MELQLGPHTAEELEFLSSDFLSSKLFTSQSARWNEHRFKNISVQLDDPSEEGEDSAEYLENSSAAVLKVLGAVRSVETLSLDVCLATDSFGDIFETRLLPILKHLGNFALRKVNKVALYVDSMGDPEVEEGDSEVEEGDSPVQEGHKCVEHGDSDVKLMKIAKVLESIPFSLLSSIHLSGGDAAASSVPNEKLWNVIASASLRNLELTGFDADISSWQPSALSQLSISWLGQAKSVDLRGAFKIIQASSETLQQLSIYNVDGLHLIYSTPMHKLILPKLSQVSLSDRHLGDGSLMHILLSSTTTPALRLLSIDTFDIMTPDLSHLPSAVPSLRKIHLGEGILLSGSRSGFPNDFKGFLATQHRCAWAGIEISVTFSSDHCTTAEHLDRNIARIRAAGNCLVSLSLSVSFTAVSGLLKGSILHFPNLARFCLNLTESEDSETELASTDMSSIKDCILAVFALKLISFNVSITSVNICAIFKQIIDVVHNGHFPLLQVVKYDFLIEQLQSNHELESWSQSGRIELTDADSTLHFNHFNARSFLEGASKISDAGIDSML